MKLTRLIQLGIFGSGTLSLAGALSSCSSGDGSLAADGGGPPSGNGAGASALGQGGAQSNAFGGSAAVAGASSIGVAGNMTGGGASSQGGVSSSGGNTSSSGTAGTSAGSAGSGNGGGSSGSGGGNSGGSSSNNGGFGGGGGQPPVIEGGSQGWASRYWDCCKPHCAWKGNVPGGSTPLHSCGKNDQSLGSNYDVTNACDNGGNDGAYMCHDYGPWAVSDKLAYGFAAVNMGSDICGKCYQLQFNGSSHTANSDPGAQGLNGKTMIVQAINTGGVDSNQFDLLIPGGGVGEKDACSAQWGTSDLGERYGGFYLACQKANGFKYAESRACAAQKCQSVFASKPELLAGCNFFVNWLGAPDNPNLVYKEVTCPAAITQMSGLKR